MLPFIAKYQTRKFLKSRNSGQHRTHGNLINSVAIVSSRNSQDFKSIKTYAKQLRERGIRVVDLFVFVPNKKALEAYPATLKDFPFCPSDFGFFGGYKSPELDHSLSTKYEVVLDLTEGSNMYSDLVLSRINANLRVGFKRKTRTKFLDLMIDTDLSNMNDALVHLDRYLFNLNNNQYAA